MVGAQLLGKHTHVTRNGIRLNISERAGKYLARFRYEGLSVGPTLGDTQEDAEAELRRIMVEIENGTFVRPSEPVAKLRKRQRQPIPNLSIPELHYAFIQENRRTKGKKTADTYASRLKHVDDFFELPRVKRRFPHAVDISGERHYALDLKDFLATRRVSRNGHPNSNKHVRKPGGIRNVLEAHRDAMNWACQPDVRKLPPDFIQPITTDIIGRKPSKDPLRPIVFGLERRLRLVRISDAYQLLTFAAQYIMPHRPEQHSGLLIRDIDWESRTLVFGTRFDEHDHTKSWTSFRVPFPSEWEPVFRAAMNARGSGPLYVKRTIYEDQIQPELIIRCHQDLDDAIQDALSQAAKAGTMPHGDVKDICRQVLARAGGVTPDSLGREFRNLASLAGVDGDFRYYDLRGSIVTEMDRAGVPDYVQRYIMGHAAIDSGSLDEYRSLTLDGIREYLTGYWRFCSELVQAVLDRGRQLRLWETG